MEYKKLNEVLDYEQPTKYLVETTNYNNNADIPVLTAGKTFILGYTNEKENIFPKEKLPVIIFDDFTTECKYVDFEFKVKSTAMKILKIKETVDIKYVYYAMKKIKFDSKMHKRYWISQYSEIKIPIPTIEVQNKISNKLDKVQEIIDLRKKQIEELDKLIKSLFIKMFGNPINNSKKIKIEDMTSVCEIIDGDRGKNYPKAGEFFEKEYCLFLNAKNVTNNGFSFENCMFITEEKDKLLRKGKLQREDVVLTTRGTVGNIAFYTNAIPFDNIRINSGMVILRMNKAKINEIFFIEQFRLQLNKIKNKVASGSAQPQLPISKMKSIKVIIPKIEEQDKYANFVQLINKQKFIVEKSLKEAEKLQESLMNKYFG